jgi:hypothetical protein
MSGAKSEISASRVRTPTATALVGRWRAYARNVLKGPYRSVGNLNGFEQQRGPLRFGR